MCVCTIIRKSITSVVLLIASFNVTTIALNTCLCPVPHPPKHITDHSPLSSQWIHLSYDPSTKVCNVSSWRFEDLTLQVPPEKKITWGEVWRSGWPLRVTIQCNNPMIEEFLKSVSYNYASMSWCSILNPPQSPESSSPLLLEMFLQLGEISSLIIRRYCSPFRLPSKKQGPMIVPFPQRPIHKEIFCLFMLMSKWNWGGLCRGAYSRTFWLLTLEFMKKATSSPMTSCSRNLGCWSRNH